MKRTLLLPLIFAAALFFLITSPASAQEIIIDNGQAGTSYTGIWRDSSAPGSYGTTSAWSRGGDSSTYGVLEPTYTWQASIPQTGQYEVYMWWTVPAPGTTLTPRAPDAPVSIAHAQGTASLSVNQQTNGAQWNSLGTYSFNGGGNGRVTIRASRSDVSYSADAVRFVLRSSSPAQPTATINSISPNPAVLGQEISFSGSGSGGSGIIDGYEWQSDIGGALSTAASFTTTSLMAGTHTISFRVRDSNQVWSEPAIRGLTVGNVPSQEIIIDNGQAGTSYTGTWMESGAPNPYGANSIYSRDGATYTWQTTLPQAGLYDVYMWWTEWPSRATNTPVTVTHAGGTASLTVNQRVNGGRWNLLGTYSFDASVAGRVRLSAPDSSPTSYCADAVRFVFRADAATRPVAVINTISPNPSNPYDIVTFNGYGIASQGEITGYRWRSNLDGDLGFTPIVTRTRMREGTHTIYFSVQEEDGDWSDEVSASLVISRNVASTEDIYVCVLYSEGNPSWSLRVMLNEIGAYLSSDGCWYYTNSEQNKTYRLHIVSNIAAMRAALETEGAHIAIVGHSNYGLGGLFSNNTELKEQTIWDVRYIDDDRIFNYSSPTVSVSTRGMRTGQAYPHWWPVYRDGTSGIMPYDFNDPRGAPPYNYYPTYRVPGDPTYYRVETGAYTAIRRFFDSSTPAWYSATGAAPNPANSSHHQYFIRNINAWVRSVEQTGNWQHAFVGTNFYRENYQVIPRGSGANTFRWFFDIPTSGQYRVYAWWPVLNTLTTNARYTVQHASGSSQVTVDQSQNGGWWRELGTYNFNTGEYAVTLSDQATNGSVAADGIRVQHVNNPPDVIQANFRANVRTGPAPLTVTFTNQGVGDRTDRLWDFGNGVTNNTRDSIEYTYTVPGTYSVSLTVSGPLGSHTHTKPGYIVVGSTATRLQAEFGNTRQQSTVPLITTFRDYSTGNIVSWLWNFGDGTTSTQQNPPEYTYTNPGIYNVSLTVTGADGQTSTETKQNFVRATVFEKNVDNVDYPKTHYGSKVIVARRELEIDPSRLRYARMFYSSCNGGNYYIDSFQRGQMWYTLNVPALNGMNVYLREYMLGSSDEEIWRTLQDFEPVYDFYDFTRRPSEQ